MIGAETVTTAYAGLVANKLRSALTILGITIGVASVIVLIAVGNGSSQAVQRNIEQLGTNVLLVMGQAGPSVAGGSSAAAGLTTDDAKAIADPSQAPDVKAAAPVLNVASATLVNGSKSYSPSQVLGTTPAYAGARDYTAQAGSLFSDQDVTDRSRVAVIGPTVVDNLFAGQNPIGQTITINGARFQVVGVTAPKGSTGPQNSDDVVFVPLSAAQDELAGYGNITSITVQAASRGQLDAAQAEVTAILYERHKVTDPTNPGFQVLNQGSILAASTSTSQVFTTLLGVVAAISLLVGGIGVMNIMLVSVTERTREIGIRKAVGARPGHILSQFLTEAVMVSVIGGVTGIAAGIVASHFKIAGVQPVIATYSVFLAFAAAGLSGLFFGTYPASRAARMRPVEALRFE
ncbi:MAG: putative transport system permease protein [Solirubrobacterales bacterium]|jgi:putative ABC transport system permease protein|nr:putative transport system permease protein [Solirubrobacterales bacterium]